MAFTTFTPNRARSTMIQCGTGPLGSCRPSRARRRAPSPRARPLVRAAAPHMRTHTGVPGVPGVPACAMQRPNAASVHVRARQPPSCRLECLESRAAAIVRTCASRCALCTVCMRSGTKPDPLATGSLPPATGSLRTAEGIKSLAPIGAEQAINAKGLAPPGDLGGDASTHFYLLGMCALRGVCACCVCLCIFSLVLMYHRYYLSLRCRRRAGRVRQPAALHV